MVIRYGHLHWCTVSTGVKRVEHEAVQWEDFSTWAGQKKAESRLARLNVVLMRQTAEVDEVEPQLSKHNLRKRWHNLSASADNFSTILVTGAVLIAITILILIAIKVFRTLKSRYRLQRQMQCQTSPRPLTPARSDLANDSSPVQSSHLNGASPGNLPLFANISTNV